MCTSLEAARSAFDSAYPALSKRASAACKQATTVKRWQAYCEEREVELSDLIVTLREDMAQNCLGELWERFSKACETDSITDPKLAALLLESMPLRFPRLWAQPADDSPNWELPELPDYIRPIDGILLLGFLSGASDRELSKLTLLPRHDMAERIAETIDRVSDQLFANLFYSVCYSTLESLLDDND